MNLASSAPGLALLFLSRSITASTDGCSLVSMSRRFSSSGESFRIATVSSASVASIIGLAETPPLPALPELRDLVRPLLGIGLGDGADAILAATVGVLLIPPEK